jgi:hypothetical protein
MRKRAKRLLPSRLTEDNIVEMSICDRGNALEKDVGKRQFFDRVRYPPPTVPSALEAAPSPSWKYLNDLVGVNGPRTRRYIGRYRAFRT